MAVHKLKVPDNSELDTKQRIMDAAINLFAVKGFDGTSIRDIAKLAQVNVASLNYHFKSKENLRQELLNYVVEEFRQKIANLPEVDKASDYAVLVFETISSDSARCMNQFKLILEAENHPCETEPYPIEYEIFSAYLAKELKADVPFADRIWLTHVVFGYLVHTAVMSCTQLGKKGIEKFMPNQRDSIPAYIKQLVESLIRDLNGRY